VNVISTGSRPVIADDFEEAIMSGSRSFIHNVVLGALVFDVWVSPEASNCWALDWGGEKPPDQFATTSPSGEYELTVKPRYGRGQSPAHYRMVRNGQEVWSAELPFSFLDAGVTDDGAVAGYGRSLVDKCGEQIEMGSEFVVAFIDSSGEVMRASRYPRWVRGYPYGFGLMMDPENDRAMVRVYEAVQGAPGESWWWYSLSTGEAWFRCRPAAAIRHLDARHARVIGVRPVAGTEQVLVHWQYQSTNGRFVLLDPVYPHLEPTWSLDLPGDYSHANEYVQRDIVEYVCKHGAILRTDEPMQFDIHLVAEHKRVTFKIERIEDGYWTVKEIARSEHRIPKHFLRRVGPPSGGEEEQQEAEGNGG
jgi:hypothetical protein